MKKNLIMIMLSMVCSTGFAQESVEQLEQRVQKLEETVKLLKKAYDNNEANNKVLHDQYVIGKTIAHVENAPLTFDLVKLEGNKGKGTVVAEVIIANNSSDKRVSFNYCYLFDSNRTRIMSQYPYFSGTNSYGTIIPQDTQMKLIIPFQLDETDTQAIQGLQLYHYSISPVESSKNEFKDVMFRNILIDWK